MDKIDFRARQIVDVSNEDMEFIVIDFKISQEYRKSFKKRLLQVPVGI